MAEISTEKLKAAFEAAPAPGEQFPAKKRTPKKAPKAKKAPAAPEKPPARTAPEKPQEESAAAPPTVPPPRLPDDEILTLDLAAEYLKVSRRQMYTLLAEKAIPARRIGKRWRFSKAALSRYVSGEE